VADVYGHFVSIFISRVIVNSCAVTARRSFAGTDIPISIGAVRRNEAVPLAVVRDLLGITRALYRGERAKSHPNVHVLEALTAIGEQLGRALDLGKGEPGTMGSRAAWDWAEKGCEALGALVADLELEPAVQETIKRLKR
jgi:hypothetical protein